MASLKSMQTSSLIREFGRRQRVFAAERDALVKRIAWLDEQIAALAFNKSKPARTNKTKRTSSIDRGSGVAAVLAVLSASKKPATMRELDDQVRKSLPAVDKNLTARTLSTLFKQKRVRRTGTHGEYRYVLK